MDNSDTIKIDDKDVDLIIDGEKYAAALFVNDGVLMMNIDGMIVVFSPF